MPVWMGCSRTQPPRRPERNAVPRFLVVDNRAPPLSDSPSPLIAEHWLAALADYPGHLPYLLSDIITFGARLGYEGPEQFVLADNLASALEDPEVIDRQLESDLRLGRVTEVAVPDAPLIISPLGLVPKQDGGWRRIHHLSHPPGGSVNDGIPSDYGSLRYSAIDDVLGMVRAAGRGCWIIKKDLKEAFRMVPVAPAHRWLLGFRWRGRYYMENCLSFGLRTAPFIFNLFAEGLHWLWLRSQPWLRLRHYLDDFIGVLPPELAHRHGLVHAKFRSWIDYLGLIHAEKKDAEGTVVDVLGIEIDTEKMEARLPASKLAKAARLVNAALTDGSVTGYTARELAGYLSFCAAVVVLGRTYLTRLWAFIATFRSQRARRPLTGSAVSDLCWWQEWLPYFNGIRLLDDSDRPVAHIWTDASSLGIGGFWYAGDVSDWHAALPVPQEQAFYAPRRDGLHINVAETEAAAALIKAVAGLGTYGRAVVHVDNTTAESALRSGTGRSQGAMVHIRAALGAAAAADLDLAVVRVTSEDNGLADALSRADWPTIANLCPNWQVPLRPSRPRTLYAGSGHVAGPPATLSSSGSA